MKYSLVSRLIASALLLCAGSGARSAPVDVTLAEIKQQIEALKLQGKYTVNTGSLAIESWLLTSTAIDSTAARIRGAIQPEVSGGRKVLVIAGNEVLDFGQAAMMEFEMFALTDRIRKVCDCPRLRTQSVGPLFGLVAGLLKSETELTAIDQVVDAKLLAAAVANGLGNVSLPSAAVVGQEGGVLLATFNALIDTADDAQAEIDRLAQIKDPSEPQKDKLAQLKALLVRYDAFYARATTANANGTVPLAAAVRLNQLIKDDPYILRVNTEKAGGTLLKRTNVLTALGAETAFISGGLVSSYQLTDPKSGEVIKAGVITCRTTLTSLKRVQQASWKSSPGNQPVAICSP